MGVLLTDRIRTGHEGHRATAVPPCTFRSARAGRLADPREMQCFHGSGHEKTAVGSGPDGGAVCAADSGVYLTLHRLDKWAPVELRRDLSLDIPQCWPTSRI